MISSEVVGEEGVLGAGRTTRNVPLKMLLAGEALPAVCAEDHGGTTSSTSETMTNKEVGGCVSVDDEKANRARAVAGQYSGGCCDQCGVSRGEACDAARRGGIVSKRRQQAMNKRTKTGQLAQ